MSNCENNCNCKRKCSFPIIDEVKNTLEERAEMYGSPEDSFERIGKMWAAYRGEEYTPKDVAIMMILMKVAREAFQHKRDNFVDIIGYAAHAGNFADNELKAEEFADALNEATVTTEPPITYPYPPSPPAVWYSLGDNRYAKRIGTIPKESTTSQAKDTAQVEQFVNGLLSQIIGNAKN